MHATRASAWTLPLAAALVAVAVRVPFLLKGHSFFTSDEAVEGLMARHLGELPVFFWGQGHKGVPEVYIAGAVFAIFGAGVIQLKSVTLGIWAAAVALLVRLTERWHGRAAATIAALLLVTGPATVLSFSLTGTAEFALLSAVLAALLLDYQRGIDATPPIVSPRVFFWCGLAVWIHPVAACAVAALAVVVGLRSERWIASGWRGVLDVVLARDRSPAVRTITLILHGALALTLLFFAFTWLGGSVRWGPVKITNSLRQLQNGTILVVLAVLLRQTTGDVAVRRLAFAALTWFVAGLSPVLIHALRGGSLRLTATQLTPDAVAETRSVVFGDALARVVGLHDPGAGSPGLQTWTSLGFVVTLAIVAMLAIRAMFAAGRRRSVLQPRDVFPVLAACAAAAALVGGGLQDAGSSRHLVPFIVVLMVSVAGAIVWLSRRNAFIAIALTIWMVSGFVWSERRWYQQLQPDDSSPALLRCLDDRHQYFGHANYDEAYRLTFLSHERVIVVPDIEQDRYLPYRLKVDAAPDQVRIERLPSGAIAAPTDDALCRTPLMTARLIPK